MMGDLFGFHPFQHDLLAHNLSNRMGITGLLPFLSNIHKKVHVGQYAGRCVAVDTSCWLHRGAFSCAFELATGTCYTSSLNIKLIIALVHVRFFVLIVSSFTHKIFIITFKF